MSLLQLGWLGLLTVVAAKTLIISMHNLGYDDQLLLTFLTIQFTAFGLQRAGAGVDVLLNQGESFSTSHVFNLPVSKEVHDSLEMDSDPDLNKKKIKLSVGTAKPMKPETISALSHIEWDKIGERLYANFDHRALFKINNLIFNSFRFQLIAVLSQAVKIAEVEAELNTLTVALADGKPDSRVLPDSSSQLFFLPEQSLTAKSADQSKGCNHIFRANRGFDPKSMSSVGLDLKNKKIDFSKDPSFSSKQYSTCGKQILAEEPDFSSSIDKFPVFVNGFLFSWEASGSRSDLDHYLLFKSAVLNDAHVKDQMLDLSFFVKKTTNYRKLMEEQLDQVCNFKRPDQVKKDESAFYQHKVDICREARKFLEEEFAELIDIFHDRHALIVTSSQ